MKRCISCGGTFKTMTRDETVRGVMAQYQSGDPLHLVTDIAAKDIESGMTYYMCSECCKKFLAAAIDICVENRKKILFYNFDELRKELKG